METDLWRELETSRQAVYDLLRRAGKGSKDYGTVRQGTKRAWNDAGGRRRSSCVKAGVKHMVSHYGKDGWTAKTVEALYPFKGYGIEGLESLGRSHNSSFPECPHRLPESSYDLI